MNEFMKKVPNLFHYRQKVSTIGWNTIVSEAREGGRETEDFRNQL
jgi:hypothetical protein